MFKIRIVSRQEEMQDAQRKVLNEILNVAHSTAARCYPAISFNLYDNQDPLTNGRRLGKWIGEQYADYLQKLAEWQSAVSRYRDLEFDYKYTCRRVEALEGDPIRDRLHQAETENKSLTAKLADLSAALETLKKQSAAETNKWRTSYERQKRTGEQEGRLLRSEIWELNQLVASQRNELEALKPAEPRKSTAHKSENDPN